jgi:hypothetical protein
MSGILDVAGVEGFMANANELYAEADVETLAWRDLTRIWWKRHGRDLVGASGLLSLLPDDADPFNLGAGAPLVDEFSVDTAWSSPGLAMAHPATGSNP